MSLLAALSAHLWLRYKVGVHKVNNGFLSLSLSSSLSVALALLVAN